MCDAWTLLTHTALSRVQLVQLKESAAVGAAALAAKEANLPLALNYEQYFESFFQFEKK